jgi:hypothetical protein
MEDCPMLMLYLFKVEVLDLGLNYIYSTDCTVIADTQEERRRLVHCQFGDHNRSALKRTVLLGARALTCGEVALLEHSFHTTSTLWLTYRLPCGPEESRIRRLPRIQSEVEIYELLERAPQHYDSLPLEQDQYLHGARFFHEGSSGVNAAAAA